ncbi:uncharacterized protein [Spinacia oleracea]|uniref:Uncharacterized protein isoform X2 n=1 Tax=Spinacia oleracea TaxID=3562 RepID=A0ABM3QSK0_SPIOL|nr:uncharacterized protein LOC110806098 isoform X2 [Spinacia oleracea]
MGKLTQARQINNIHATDDKTSTNFKLAHMFHVLDYHRWHYVKKVLSNKKHYEERHASGSDPKAIANENDQCYSKEFEAHNTSWSLFGKNSSFHSSPRSESSPSTPFKQPKSSRALRISKMIIKEVTKRKGRHRRSSTCPTGSELEGTTLANQHMDIIGEEIGLETKQDIIPSQNITESNGKCDLCSSMKIECRLGGNTQPEKQVDKPLVYYELPFKGKIDTSASFHHSKEFLDALCVLGMNKEFSLNVLDDPGSSLRNGLLTKQLQATRSIKRKFLEKLGTFPINESSGIKDFSFSGSYKRRDKSDMVENKPQQNLNNTNTNSGQIVGRRFKDLRQKIKHLIKENRKERRRIAMDAILHKVPYGHKVYEQSMKESPCVSICDSDSSNKERKSHKKRSSSLDESLDKYCQLFEATSVGIGKEEKINTPEISRLRVVNENSSKRVFGRMFSSPDFHDTSDDYEDGNMSFTLPSRRTMSFSERKGDDDLSINIATITQFNQSKEPIFNDLDDYVEISNVEGFSLVDIHEENTKADHDGTYIETTNAHGVAICDDNGRIIVTPCPSITSVESHQQMDSNENKEILLEDSELAQQEDFFMDSPWGSYIKVDENGENIVEDEEKRLMHFIPPNHHHIRVSDYEIEEFKYVRNILELSGYLGTQLLGTWYSSDQPVDPCVFVELESCSLLDLDCSNFKDDKQSSHLLLFDMINEVLLSIYERSVSYWSSPLSSCSRKHPMPKGHYVLEEVWSGINWYMCCSKPDFDPSLDNITTRDLAKYDGWMNLQFDAECVGLEVEDLIFEDLLNEFMP